MRTSVATRSAAAAVALLPLLAVPADGASVVRTAPRVTPAYRAGTPDYSVRCRQSTGVTVKVKAPKGTRVAVDGRPLRRGSFEAHAALAPGQAFSFRVQRGKRIRTHRVRCVPADFPRWRVERRGKPAVSFIAFAPTIREVRPNGAPYSVIADSHGVPLWWKRADAGIPVDTKVLPDGTVAWARLGGSYSQTEYTRVGLDGTPLGSISTVGVGADQHDLQVLPNGNYLMIAYVARPHVDLSSLGGPADATVLDGELQEVTPAGELVWSWNSKDHVELAETAAFGLESTKVMYNGEPAYDLVHLNSAEQKGGAVLVSARHVDAVYRVRRSDGDIDWKLGGTSRAESLAFKKDPLGTKSFGGQHDARLLPDGTVSIHDNGSKRGRPPRIARYRIDVKRRTATLVQQLTDRRVKASFCCGSGRRLPGGHWLASWGGNSVITELTAVGRPVLTLTFATKLFSYRAQPVPASTVSRDALRAGMDAQFPR